MTEPRDRIVKAQRAVSIREFIRCGSRLLDEVERDGSIFVLGRRGKMVALLSPLPERTYIELAGPSPTPEPLDEDLPEEIPDEWRELSEIQRLLLARGLEDYPRPFSLEGTGYRVADVSIAIVRLELLELVTQDLSKRLTQAGYDAARWLAARVDKPDAPQPS